MVNRIEPPEEHIDMRDDDDLHAATAGRQAADTPASKPVAAKADKAVKAADSSLPPLNTDADDAATDPVVPSATGVTDDNNKSEPVVPLLTAEPDNSDPAVVIQSGRQHRFRQWLARRKKVVIPVILLLVAIGVLAGVPVTRYAIAGTVLKQQFAVVVTDSQTGKPVSSADITLKGVSAKTDSQGKATLKAAVGKGTLTLDKRYYKGYSQEVLVPIRKPQPLTVKFEATGRQVSVTVVNKISGKALKGATVSAENTQAITDEKGETTIVLPADKNEAKATISADTYNKLEATVKITAAKDEANTFKLTPAGKLYFLSNASGTIDIVKTDLDGRNRQVVLKGTGAEDRNNTALLASQNWKYLAFLSKRDGGANAKLFLIDTSNDALTTMDEGDADFSPVGWSGTTFVYQISRHNKQLWDTKASALKSYEAAVKKLHILDETAASGTGYSAYSSETYAGVSILNNEVIFGKNVSAASPSQFEGRKAQLISIRPDGSSRKVVRDWVPAASSTYVDAQVRPYGPDEVYVASTNADPDHLYEYENSQLKTVEGKKAQDIWNSQYFTYFFSPSNKLTFWSEPRDGKNTLFVGNATGENSKQIAAFSEYQTFGWFTEDYLLLSKNASELYVLPATVTADAKPLKVADYLRSNLSIPGYGKGYGAF